MKNRSTFRRAGRMRLGLVAGALALLLLGGSCADLTTDITGRGSVARLSSADQQAAAPVADAAALSPGLWIGADELAALPMSGDAWERLTATADGDLGRANIADQNSDHDVDTLAVALVAARTGDARYRAKAVASLLEAIGTEDNEDSSCGYRTRPDTAGSGPPGARAMAIGRNLPSYVIAADLVGLRGGDSPEAQQVRDWIDHLLHRAHCPNTSDRWYTLAEVHDGAGSNGNAMAGGARIAAALYLGDEAEVARAWDTYRRYSGDRSVGPDLGFNDAALTWSHDPSAPVAINPAGTTKDGHRIDGAIINDISRAGRFQWPPRPTGYVWEGAAGYFVQAQLLARAGYPAWEVQDRAPLRVLEFLYELDQEVDADWWSETDWVKYLASSVYDTDFPIDGPADRGRNMAWTDWTHGGASGLSVAQRS